MKKMLSPAALALFVAAATLPGLALPAIHHPVNVTACEPSRNVFVTGGWVPGYYPAGPYYWPSIYGYRYYQPPVRTTNPTLAISYSNNTTKTMKRIEFGLVAGGDLVAEVQDVGTFTPGAPIKHEFGLSPNVFPLRTSLTRCVPLRITFEDGSTWRNKHLPALRRRLGL